MNYKIKKSGTTLLELLIASLLVSLLFAGLLKLLTSISKLSEQQRNLVSLQEKFLFIQQFFKQRIKAAGQTDCLENQPSKSILALRGYSSSAPANGDVLELGECIYYKRRYQFVRLLYYVAGNNRSGSALYQKVVGGRRQELLDGVIKMRLHYTFGSKSAGDSWSRVRGVEIHLNFENHKKWVSYVALQHA